MIREDLIDLIGEEEYLSAVQSFRTGTATSVEFAHDIQYHFEQLGFSEEQKWQTWKELVYEIPCYSIWLYVNMFYVNQTTEAQKNELLRILTDLLENGNVAQVNAVKYALWVDFFEDPSTVEKCWNHLTETIKTEAARNHLMEISGPVPYGLKRTYYESSLGTHSHRIDLQTGLKRSCIDIYGDIDVTHALHLVEEIERVDAEIDMSEVRALLKTIT